MGGRKFLKRNCVRADAVSGGEVGLFQPKGQGQKEKKRALIGSGLRNVNYTKG